jgi:hypothetical protein
MGRDALLGVRRTFITYEMRLSQSSVVARVTELQRQQLRHFQLLQHFADLRVQDLQQFWQNAAYIQGLWHRIAIVPLPPFMPFVPIYPSGVDDISDNSPALAKSYRLKAKSYQP